MPGTDLAPSHRNSSQACTGWQGTPRHLACLLNKASKHRKEMECNSKQMTSAGECAPVQSILPESTAVPQ